MSGTGQPRPEKTTRAERTASPAGRSVWGNGRGQNREHGEPDTWTACAQFRNNSVAWENQSCSVVAPSVTKTLTYFPLIAAVMAMVFVT